MKLHDLRPAEGSHRKRKRIGRGHGSGKVKTGGKGMMGQKARSGPGPYRTFEGGQNRLVKRMPFKRGFTNKFRVEYEVVNVGSLVDWPTELEVTPETLLARRLVRRKKMPVKILGDGELNQPLVIKAHKFSASARQKIEAAGGKAIDLTWIVERHSRSRGPNPSMRNARQS
ncbi:MULTISPECIES: 50S ribosomal protein L15 [Chloroflexus]|jgi:large subunit ribosomal protein L15|uniref:Large ribosomal subunit protein uL15 n=1 Tax=Chloroflexus aggregans (strain MD-66 / DSM 9485) TaxID=326427 RepID=RL15_CHLAD|nr:MULTISPECIES: 50S ribosomal protein L15 [Chloroflexus]B8G6Q6.1 RecName: Full=Large ribosomal subunit protein uL15; AltName: Full=50S ribosomal protein L15 [Chloroflexus aggregans DSM 9485]ACL25865.1 ribosomal protein L15 [Chloroflexus aggregans DSM 9485]GIV87792.1 MAG: 50S ribosomal protein L15 [Chloroflexus sp.]